MFYCGFNRFLHRVPNLVVGETESRASTTPTTTTFHQRMSAINPRREFVWGKATETGGETPLRARERKGWAAETPNSHQRLERGVHMGRTRECFGADIPNLVAAKTERRASTITHHHCDPAKRFSNQPAVRVRVRKGGPERHHCESKKGEDGMRVTKLTTASRERCSHGPHARVLQRRHPQSGCCQD